ncbi:ATP-binding protein [Rubrivirga marina]|uniref:histidine kinase n=1 Tax=Rubrivirga marina TaxID=1196024 RepID=A0A271IXQ9_9BACT|nr:ATP-binding protein [Rubrivirga marina]PAP75910.1 hypothetical protein BSZ37_05375 [Rubrivirga marina]
MFSLIPEVIPLVCQALMAGIAGAYVLSIPRKTRSAWWLVVLFGGQVAFAGSYLLGVMSAGHEGWAIRFNIGLYAGVALAAFAAVRVSYTFLARPFRREERVASWALGGALAALLGLALYAGVVIEASLLTPLLYGYGLYLVAATLWALGVHVRQVRRFRGLAAEASSRAASQRRGATGHVMMAGLVGVMLSLSVLNALATVGVLPLVAIQYGSLLVELVYVVGLVVAFINYAPEPTTVQAKLVGVSLGVVLGLLGVTSLTLLRSGEIAEAARNAIPAEAAVQFSPDGAGGYRVLTEAASVAPPAGARRLEPVPREAGRTWGEAMVELPFAFRIGGEAHRSLSLSRVPYLAFDAPEPCSEVCVGVNRAPSPDHPMVLAYVGSADYSATDWPAVTASADRLDVVWTVAGLDGRASEHRATLWADGTVEIAYRGEAQRPRIGSAGLHPGGTSHVAASFAEAVPPSVAAGAALVDPYGARFAALAHLRTARVLPIVFGAAGFVLVLVPLFLRRGVLGPLAALLDGVERVDRGDRDVHVDPGANDEFGTLTRRFNTMTASLGTAEDRLRQYAGELEERVAERTRELESANADLAEKHDALEASLAELHAAQDRLVQAEKLASLGRLTAGIAHEIKNPLNFVTNFAGLAQEAVGDLRAALLDGDLDEAQALLGDLAFNAERIEHHGRRADRIVQGMQLHARGSSGERVASELNDLLRLAAEGAVRTHAARVGGDGLAPIDLDLGPDVGAVLVVPEGVLQVAASLLDNALYATAEAGAATPVRLSSRRTDGVVEVRVSDGGPGMDADTLARLFEPFFTTKSPGEGTGLGLSLAYDIVTAGHGGQIEVDSRPGAGTTVTVRLPAGG